MSCLIYKYPQVKRKRNNHKKHTCAAVHLLAIPLPSAAYVKVVEHFVHAHVAKKPLSVWRRQGLLIIDRAWQLHERSNFPEPAYPDWDLASA